MTSRRSMFALLAAPLLAGGGLLAAATAFAQSPPPAAPPPAAPAPDAVGPTHLLNQTVPMPFGEIVEDCIEDKLALYFVLNLSRFGAPEERRDTVVQYDPARGTIHVAMYGGAETTDDAKKRLESRKTALDFAVKLCAQELNTQVKELYGYFEMTYTRVDREAGKRWPLIRWHRGRWELL